MENPEQTNITPDMEVVWVEDPQQALKVADEIIELDGYLAGDTETMPKDEFKHIKKAALDPLLANMRTAQFASSEDHRAFVFDLRHTGLEPLQKVVEAREVFFHHLKFDLKHMLAAGIEPYKVQDTLMLQKILCAPEVSLKATVKEWLGIDMPKEMGASDWSLEVLSDEQKLYAARDVYLLARVIPKLVDYVANKQPAGIDTYKRFNKITPLTARMELRGIPFDAEGHLHTAEHWADQAEKLKERVIEEMGGINPASPKQVGAWLEANLKKGVIDKWPRNEASGSLKTSADEMAKHASAHPAISVYAEWKKISKLDGTYGKGIQDLVHPVTGNLHPEFNILGARTGRFTSNRPNIQNQPREGGMREHIRAPEGYVFIDADYSQIELRIAATMAGDKAMLSAYENGEDLHTLTAASITGKDPADVTGEDRRKAKAANFGLTYGCSADTLKEYAENTFGATMDIAEARQWREAFFERNKDLAQWQTETTNRAATNLNSKTAGGYIRNYVREGGNSSNVYTKSLNTPVQGTGAEMLIEALYRTDLGFTNAGIDAQVIAHVHDEILCMVAEADLDKAVRILKDSMIDGAVEILPRMPTRDLIEVKVGYQWSKEMDTYTPGWGSTTSPEEAPAAQEELTEVGRAFQEINAMGYSLVTMPAEHKDPGRIAWGRKAAEYLPPNHNNLGIIHGLSQTCCLDLDNLEKSREAFAHYGIDIDALCENSPACTGNPVNRSKVFFKMPDGLKLQRKKLLANKQTIFEFRGNSRGGQVQDLIPPSIHPSGFPYKWQRPLVPLAELPVLPPELVDVWQNFDEKYNGGMASALGDFTVAIEKMVNGGGGSFSDRTKRYVEEFNRRHPITEMLELAGYIPPARGMSKWTHPDSSTGVPGVLVNLEENYMVSFHGSDPLGDEKPKDSFAIFRQYVHNNDYQAAKNAMIEEIGELPDPDFVPITEEEIEAGKLEAGGDNEKAPPAYDGMEKGMQGFVRRIFDYYMNTAYVPYQPFGLAAALSAFSTITQNYYTIDKYNLGLNLYHVLIADTGHGKEGPRDAIKKLFGEIELAGVVSESIASGPAIKRRLHNERNLLLMTDELGSALAAAAGKNADVHQVGLLKELRTLYSSATTFIGGHNYADSRRDIPSISRPYVNLFGTSTPGQLMDAISRSQIENGLINRLVMIEAEERPSRREERVDGTPPEDLVRDLKEFAMRRHNYLDVIRVTPEAQAVIKESERFQDELLGTGSEVAGLFGRLTEHCLRVAGILAVSERPEKPVMTEKHMAWARDYIYAAFKRMEQSFEERFFESEYDKQIKHLLRVMKEYTDSVWVPRSELSRKTRLNKKWIDDHRETLLDREMIEVRVDDAGKKGGRKPEFWRLTPEFFRLAG